MGAARGRRQRGAGRRADAHPRENQLAGVEDVFNAVLVKGDMLGDVVFYGKGAGKLPTASAVVADVIDALKNGVKIHDSLFWQESAPIEGLYGDSTPADHYVRLENATEAVAKDLFGQQIEMLDTSDGEAVFTLRGVTSGRLAELCARRGPPACAWATRSSGWRNRGAVW